MAKKFTFHSFLISIIFLFSIQQTVHAQKINFPSRSDFATGTSPIVVATADINGDGKPDIITANQGANTVSVLLNTTTTGETTPTFSANTELVAGNNTYSVAVADINGDGKPDIAVVNANDNTLGIFINTTATSASTASFSVQTVFTVGASPTSVAIADVNSDGKPDIVVTNGNDNTVSVLLNNTSTGTSTLNFSAQTVFAVGINPTYVVLADLNNDGKPDIITSNQGSNTVSVLINTTSTGASGASFLTKSDIAAGSRPYTVTTADVNDDGKPDIISANLGSNTVSVLLNTTSTGASAPTFADSYNLPTGSGPYSVVTSDIDGNGKPDIVVTNLFDNTVSVLLNSTSKGAVSLSFAAQSVFATAGNSPYSVATADINSDGQQDIIIVNIAKNTVSVLLNETGSAPTFSSYIDFKAGNSPYAVSNVDLNNDGKLDLVVTNLFDNTVSVILNTTSDKGSTVTYASQTVFPTGTGPYSFAIKDLNNDGKPDIIAANANDNTVSVLLNTTSTGASTPTFTSQAVFPTGDGPYSVSITDVNVDGKPDIVVSNFFDNTVSVLLNTTSAGATIPTFAYQTVFPADNGPYSVTTADVNGDGKPDVITANFANTVSVLLNKTLTGAATPTYTSKTDFTVGAKPYSIAAADINGDGKPDIITANLNGNSISVLLNTTSTGELTPAFSSKVDVTTGVNPVYVSAADINGDSKPDIVTANFGSNSVSVLMNTTPVGASAPTFSSTDLKAEIGPTNVSIADVNNDGKQDIVSVNNDSNTISIFLNSVTITSAKEEHNQKPANFELSQNYPNPFNPTTNIKYSIAKSGIVTLKVYNLLGQEVATLVNQVQSPGNYNVIFNAADLSSGVYMYRIWESIPSGQSGNFSITKKMILLK